MEQANAKNYLKGLLAPFCSSFKRYQIPFGSLQKGIRYRLQNSKIRENQIVLHAVVKYLPAACKRVADCLLGVLQKVIKYPLEQIACGICELHATPIMLAIYR
jgi:hypothetical protein